MGLPILVIIRGNSGSGKTTVAREVRARAGRGCALIEQDQYRRIVLREHEGAGFDLASPQFIADAVRSALRLRYHVIVEGILYTEFYRTVLHQVIAEHAGPSHVFYFDIPLDETLRRNHDRAATAGFTAEDMRGWYRERDLLGADGEQVIDAEATFEDAVATILHHSGLADAAPLAPCPVTCPRCTAKASTSEAHRPAALVPATAAPPIAGAAAPMVVAALAIVPADDGQVVFVRQQRGPYAGSLLLPGGKVEPGEALDLAARREAHEEAGVYVGTLAPTGVYDISGHGPTDEGYRFLMFAFRAGPDAVRVADGGHHVDAVVLAEPGQVSPHPTVRRILNDAGVAEYDPTEIERDLRQAGITLQAYPIGAQRC